MFPANADFELGSHPTPSVDRESNKTSNPRLVKDLEGVIWKDTTLHVARQKTPRIVPAESVGRLG